MPVHPHARRSQPAGGPDTQSSRSAAWLAGERLFQALPREEDPGASPVVVTLRRNRIAATAARGEAGAVGEQDGAPASTWKGARVFRVETPDTASPDEDAPSVPVELRNRPSRRGRIGVDRRPGPVVQVFKAEPAPSESALPAFAVQISELNALRAQVQRLLAEALHAQSLRF